MFCVVAKVVPTRRTECNIARKNALVFNAFPRAAYSVSGLQASDEGEASA